MNILAQKTSNVNRPVIRLQSDISAAALKLHKSRQLALWYCLRSLNTTGSGVLDKQYAVEQLVSQFGYSEKTAYKHIRLSLDGFLSFKRTNTRSTIALEGIESVGRYLGITLLFSCHFKRVTIEQFNSVSKRSAQIYASILNPEGIKASPRTRENLTAVTGVHKVQQLRFEKKAQVQVLPAYAKFVVKGVKCSAFIPVHTKKLGWVAIRKRLGNIFHTSQEADCKGILKRVNSQLRGVFKGDEAPTLKRVFYPSLAALAKALATRTTTASAGYYRLKTNSSRNAEYCLVEGSFVRTI